MDISLSILFIPLTILLLSLYKLLSLSSKPRLPPGPTPLPIVGNIFEFNDRPVHHSLAHLANVYGHIMSLKFGLTTTIVVSSPEAACEVLQKKDAFFSTRQIPDSFHVFDHYNVSLVWLPSKSPLWKQLRAICSTYLFSVRNLESRRQIREKKVHELVEHFHRKAGCEVNLHRIIFPGLLNVISNFLFSQDVVDINSELQNEFEESITGFVDEIIKPNVSDLFPFLGMFDLQGRKRTLAVHLRKLYSFFYQLMDARLNYRNNNSGMQNGDFLDCLLDMHIESKMNRHEIQALLTVNFYYF